MDFFRFQELMDYWERYPPPHLEINRVAHIVAALGGVKLPDAVPRGVDASLIDPRMLAGAGIKVEL